jgi:hypothetical protein
VLVKAPEEATLLLVSSEVKDPKEVNRIVGIGVGKSSGGAAFYSLRWSEAEPQERIPEI